MMTQSLGRVSLASMLDGDGDGGGGGGGNDVGGNFRTKEENDLKALRASAVTKVVNEIQTVEDAVRNVHNVVAEIVRSDRSVAVSSSKKLISIDKALGLLLSKLGDLSQRVESVEEYYKDFRKALLTEIKKEYINVPAPKNENPRHMVIQPFEIGDVKKKRRNASVATAPSSKKAATAASGGEDDKKTTRHKRKRKTIEKAEKKRPVKKEPACGGGGGKGSQKKKGKTIIKSEPTPIGSSFGGSGPAEPMLPSSFTNIKWEDDD